MRPIRFQLAYETINLTKREMDYNTESQSHELLPVLYRIEDRIIEISHKLLRTILRFIDISDHEMFLRVVF